jgi:hypothetical protein
VEFFLFFSSYGCEQIDDIRRMLTDLLPPAEEDNVVVRDLAVTVAVGLGLILL